MGQRGPQRLPVEHRQRDGSYKPSAHGDVLLVAGRECPVAPEYIARHARRLEVWNRLVADLGESRLLDRVDWVGLPSVVILICRVEECQAALDRMVEQGEELVARVGKNGAEQPSVWFGLQMAAMKELRQSLNHWGLSASSRSALSMSGAQGKSLDSVLGELVGEAVEVAADGS